MWSLWPIWKRVVYWVVVTVPFAAFTYGIQLLGYYLNRTFIMANLGALPFKYRIFLGFARGEWWAFVLSLCIGLLSALVIWVSAKD